MFVQGKHKETVEQLSSKAKQIVSLKMETNKFNLDNQSMTEEVFILSYLFWRIYFGVFILSYFVAGTFR